MEKEEITVKQKKENVNNSAQILEKEKRKRINIYFLLKYIYFQTIDYIVLNYNKKLTMPPHVLTTVYFANILALLTGDDQGLLWGL